MGFFLNPDLTSSNHTGSAQLLRCKMMLRLKMYFTSGFHTALISFYWINHVFQMWIEKIRCRFYFFFYLFLLFTLISRSVPNHMGGKNGNFQLQVKLMSHFHMCWINLAKFKIRLKSKAHWTVTNSPGNYHIKTNSFSFSSSQHLIVVH